MEATTWRSAAIDTVLCIQPANQPTSRTSMSLKSHKFSIAGRSPSVRPMMAEQWSDATGMVMMMVMACGTRGTHRKYLATITPATAISGCCCAPWCVCMWCFALPVYWKFRCRDASRPMRDVITICLLLYYTISLHPRPVGVDGSTHHTGNGRSLVL